MVRRAIPGDRLLVVLPGVGGASRAPFHVQIHERLPLRNGRRGRAVGRLSGLPAGGRRNADPAIRILVKRLGAGGRPQQQKHARSLVPGRFLNARSAGVAPATPGKRSASRLRPCRRRHPPSLSGRFPGSRNRSDWRAPPSSPGRRGPGCSRASISATSRGQNRAREGHHAHGSRRNRRDSDLDGGSFIVDTWNLGLRPLKRRPVLEPNALFADLEIVTSLLPDRHLQRTCVRSRRPGAECRSSR